MSEGGGLWSKPKPTFESNMNLVTSKADQLATNVYSTAKTIAKEVAKARAEKAAENAAKKAAPATPAPSTATPATPATPPAPDTPSTPATTPATSATPATADKEEEEPDLTFFEQIKKDAKDGKFTDIVKSLPSPPPFPTALVMQIIMSLNDIFQQNIGKVGQYANITIDSEIEKKKNELELTKALGEQAKKTDLETHMPIYVTHVLNK